MLATFRSNLHAYAARIVGKNNEDHNKYFDGFVLVVIIANSILLAFADYRYVDETGNLTNQSWRNSAISSSEYIFTAIFTTECVLKIISYGFYAEKGYINDSWNWLDFTVVIFGLVSLLPGIPNVSTIRTIRAVRPLRTIAAVPGLQRLVNALFEAVPELSSVAILLCFLYLIFGIAGLQILGGPYMHATCRLTPYPVTLDWNPGLDPSHYKCLNASNFNLPSDEPLWGKADSPWSTSMECKWPPDMRNQRLCSLTGSFFICLYSNLSKDFIKKVITLIILRFFSK